MNMMLMMMTMLFLMLLLLLLLLLMMMMFFVVDPGEKWLGYEGVGEDEELLASGKAAPTPVNRRRAARQGRESNSEQKQEASKGGRESN